MEKGRLWALAGCSLLLYGMIGWMGFRSWQGSHEAKAVIAHAETYRKAHGHIPDCDCDLGINEDHAFYDKKSNNRYVVDYFGFLGMTRYDSSTDKWDTAYWWTPGKFRDAR